MKKFWLCAVCLFLMMAAVGCGRVPDSCLTIVASDVTNAPVGEYTLPYSITDYEEYAKKYDLTLTVRVYDEDNKSVTVTNNRTVTLEKDKVYTAVIRLEGKINGENITRYKQFFIASQKGDLTVTFYLRDSNVSRVFAEYGVIYGGSLPLSEIGEIPDYYVETSSQSAYKRIVAKYWTVEEEEGTVPLTQAHLTGITKNISVYAKYEYEITERTLTVTYDSVGGSSVPSFTGKNGDIITRPTDPTKENAVFDGWCTDEACTEFFNWRGLCALKSDMTLYAKWETVATEHTPFSYFNFTAEKDSNGNNYYILSVKDKTRVGGMDIVLPNAYNNLPVKALADNAFSATDITSVYIPKSYSMGMRSAFSYCEKLIVATFEENNPMTQLSARLFCGCLLLQEINIPSSVTELATRCFYGCYSLSSVTLPENLLYIREEAFTNCTALTEVTLPYTVTYLGNTAFSGCSCLSALNIPSNTRLSYFASDVLNDTAVLSVTVPDTLSLNLDNKSVAVNYLPTK